MINPARAFALRALILGAEKKTFSDAVADRFLKNEALNQEDQRLFSQLYYGVIEKKITLDYLLSQVSSRPLNTCSPAVLCLLELGAYQILYLDRIPDRAAIFEAGELAKQHCRNSLSFINAVLRKVSAEKETLPQALNHPGKKGLSLRYGYPKWMITLWQEAYGAERCEEILKAQNTPAPLTLRINTLRNSVSEYEVILAERGIKFHRNALSAFCLTLDTPIPPVSLPGYDSGAFFIQDAAAAHAIDRLEIFPGHRVLDLCAAPGGKTFAAAMALQGRGEILALELHGSRIPRILEGAKRLNLTGITAEENDSSQPRPDLFSRFDRVICDVPCSGYGTIAKKPDIRHKDKAEGEKLPPLQEKILETAASAVVPGGRILYSTCTLNPAENEAVTEAFLRRHPDFSRIGESETIFPTGGENDGFYCEILEKQNG